MPIPPALVRALNDNVLRFVLYLLYDPRRAVQQPLQQLWVFTSHVLYHLTAVLALNLCSKPAKILPRRLALFSTDETVSVPVVKCLKLCCIAIHFVLIHRTYFLPPNIKISITRSVKECKRGCSIRTKVWLNRLCDSEEARAATCIATLELPSSNMRGDQLTYSEASCHSTQGTLIW